MSKAEVGVPGGIERRFYDISKGSFKNNMEVKLLYKRGLNAPSTRDINAPSTIVVEARGGFGPGSDGVWDIYLNIGTQYKIGDR